MVQLHILLLDVYEYVLEGYAMCVLIHFMW